MTMGPTVPSHADLQKWIKPKKGKNGIKAAASVVQTVYCEVCKIECNSKEVLVSHKQGKKHKKNLLKLQESFKPKPAIAFIGPTMIGVKTESSVSKQTKKKNAPASIEELDAKKRRVLEGGAAAEEMKVCTICNVVVNSLSVYESHVAGQKHAAMLQKCQELLDSQHKTVVLS